MNEQEIQKIIDMTIKNLKKNNLLRDSNDIIYKETGNELFRYFRGVEDEKIKQALADLEHDDYIQVLYLYYRDNIKTEVIAEQLKVDFSTVMRNKKRLVLEVYKKII